MDRLRPFFKLRRKLQTSGDNFCGCFDQLISENVKHGPVSLFPALELFQKMIPL